MKYAKGEEVYFKMSIVSPILKGKIVTDIGKKQVWIQPVRNRNGRHLKKIQKTIKAIDRRFIYK